MKKEISYLGNDWVFKHKNTMYGDYEGWTGFVYYPKSKDNEFVAEDIEYKNGSFNHLSPELHIAVEDVARNPTGTRDFNDLFIAKKNDAEWPDRLPNWE